MQEEIAEEKIMLQQMSMIFGEKEIAKIKGQKFERLKEEAEGKKEVEVVCGRHECNGELYAWISPNKHPVKIGGIAMVDTRRGECPIIIESIAMVKMKNVKQHKCITKGVQE